MEIIKFLQQFSTPLLDKFFILVTMMGEDKFFIAALTFIFWCIDKRLAYKLGFAYMLNGAVNSSIKEIFKEVRPIGQPGIFSLRTETATGYSFPSGHTESAASFWTSVMLRIRKKWFFVLGSALILLVAVSRLYLGVHWPRDVFAGAVLGVAVVLLSNRLFDGFDRSKKKHYMLFILIPVFIGMLAFHTEDFYKAAGVVCSFALGYILDDLYVRFNAKALLYQQFIKYIIGLSVLLCIKSGLKSVFPDLLVFHFLRYFLMGIWVTVLAPVLFRNILHLKYEN